MRRRRRTPPFVGLLLGIAGCAPEDAPPVALEILPDGVEMTAINMDTYLTREGVRRARLQADTAWFRGDGDVDLRPVALTFYDEMGNELSVITGDFGDFNEMTEDMEAWGNVVALDRRDDQRLETSRIRYVSNDDRLFGDEPFTLHKDNGQTEIQGSSFETDPGLSSVLMLDSSGRTQQSTRPTPPPASQPDSTPAEPLTVEAAAQDSGRVVSGDSSQVTTPPDSAGVATPADTGGVALPLPDSAAVAPPDTTVARR